jgi:hypothetical protein
MKKFLREMDASSISAGLRLVGPKLAKHNAVVQTD